MQVRFQDLAWIDAPMPDGSGPVQLAQLPALDDQAFRAFVRFPAGWSRPATGYYPVHEEVFVIEGDLTFNDDAWHAGGYAWIPAHATRRGLRSEQGALVLAWFSGPPRWKCGVSPTASQEAMTTIASWQSIPAVEIGGMPQTHVLRDTGDHRTWVTRANPSIVFQRPVERFSIDDRSWQ
ncbi:MAG: hypothetical protein ACKVQT_24380, partial [Burkholderiales bacterium]